MVPLPRMDLTHLRYFRAIARTRSLTAAARELGVSQPTLSVAVRGLEEELRTRLLTRTRAGVELTATGEVLSQRAEVILQAVDDTARHIQEVELDEAGRFTVGCQESLGAYFLPGFLDRFLTRYPAIEIALYNAPSAAVRDAVLRREVDFGLVVNCEPQDDLVITPLFRDVIELCALARRSPDARITQSRLDGVEGARRLLDALPLILCERPVFRSLLARLEAEGIAARRTLVCGDLELVKSLTLEGIGVGMLPRRVASHGHPGALRPLSPLLPQHDDIIHLVSRADLHRTRAARCVREALVEHGRVLDATLDLQLR